MNPADKFLIFFGLLDLFYGYPLYFGPIIHPQFFPYIQDILTVCRGLGQYLMNLNNFSKAIVSSSHKNNGHHAGTLPRNSKSEDDLLSKNNVVINKKCNREGCNNDVFKEVCSY